MNKLLAILTLFFASFSSLNAQTVIHSETFSASTLGTWTAVSTAGPTDVWAYSSSGTPTNGYALVNGFGDEDDIDWLISPALNLDNSTGETFIFKYRDRFVGPDLLLYYTTNYTNDPNTTTWVSIPISLTDQSTTAAQPASFLSHTPIDLSAISGTNVRLAFKYYTTGVTAGNAEEWQLDDMLVQGAAPCLGASTQATALNAASTVSTANLTWTKGDGNKTIVLINNTNSFTDPVNGTTYSANAVYSGSGQQVIYIGTGASMTVSGLAATTTYYLQAYNMSDCSTPVTYITTTPAFDDFTTNSNTGGGEPSGYYNAAIGLTCAAKKNALETIITAGYNSRSYTQLWTDYLTTDDRKNDAGTTTIVWDMYTDNPSGSECEFTFGSPYQDTGTSGSEECQKYNREHSFPKSWFGGFTSTGTPGTDLFHVYPTDKKVNNVRGNQPYGEVNNPTYTSANGSKFGPSSVIGLSGNVFEPINAYKGDFARTYFYMATRYGNVIGGWPRSYAEARLVLDSTSWPAYNIPSLKMLIKWHNNDPVSQKEIDRNNAVYGIQGNRNPYIDHPEYVGDVWGVCGLGIIPVTLKTFDGVYKNQNVQLNWKVENEYAFDHYLVERSTDGVKFSTINTVKAQNLATYSMEDALVDVKKTRVYYRLKMVDQNGSFEYSRIISVQVPQQKGGLLFYPNPATTEITVKATSEEMTDLELIITDAYGKIWLQKQISTSLGSPKQLNISQLAAGNYFLTTFNKGAVEHQRLTVVR
jgi:endonuclease I